MPMPIRLLLADDHSIVLMGLVALLELEEGLSVVATARDGAEAVALFRKHRPDVALVDLRMPGTDGIRAAQLIREEFADAKILVLTSFDGEDDIHLALKAGVKGYLLKEVQRPELVAAIREVHEGGRWIPQQVARVAAERARQPDLSKRELDVLDLVAKGLTNKEIAQVLGFSADGAKQHLKRIYAKLGVEGRTEAASEAFRRGLLRQG